MRVITSLSLVACLAAASAAAAQSGKPRCNPRFARARC